MKYVVFESMEGGVCRRYPVIFPTGLVHVHMAKALTAPGGPLEGWTPVSAGDTTVLSPGVHGKSTTLGLEPSALDKMLINTIDHTHGIVEIIGTVNSVMQAAAASKQTPVQLMEDALKAIDNGDTLGAMSLAGKALNQFKAEKAPKLTGAQQKFKGGWPT